MEDELIGWLFHGWTKTPEPKGKERLEEIVWPTEEELKSRETSYACVQIEYNNEFYHRFVPQQAEIKAMLETMRIAQEHSFGGYPGHFVALDNFVRELSRKGYGISGIQHIAGFDVEYDSQKGVLNLKEKSTVIGNLCTEILTSKLIKTPKYLSVSFENSEN